MFPLLNPFARIPVCGLISLYNATSLSPGPILLPHLMRAILTKRLTFRGFIVSDFSARYGDFMRDVSSWVREGRINIAKTWLRDSRTRRGPSSAYCAERISVSSWSALRAKSPVRRRQSHARPRRIGYGELILHR